MRRILGPAAAVFIALVAALWGVALNHDAYGQDDQLEVSVHLPLALNSSLISAPTVATPRDTPWPSRTPRATAITPTAGPSPTPTLAGPEIEHPMSETIILQIGWSWTDQVGSVWQEMEGTPWMTVYGNGRVIAGHKLLDRRQILYEGHVSEYQIQLWLRDLAYDIGFFNLGEAYDHPEASKPSMHVYVLLKDGYKRVTVRGWKLWTEEYPPSIPDAYAVKKLTDWVVALQDYNAASFTEPHEVEAYTILAQKINSGPLLPISPEWTSPAITITAIAAGAPLAKPSKVDRLVGHLPVDKTLGKQVWDIVVPVADSYFMLDNRAAEFMSGGEPYAVGARQEVPGGSDFLPEWIEETWYLPNER